MKRSTILILVLFLTACSGGRQSPPSNLDNACAMKSARSGWFKDLRRVERKWGVPDYVILATVYQESKFVAKARTPLKFALGVIPMGRRSSAYGYSQALDGTWAWYLRENSRRSARRDRFDDATDFMGWYMNETFERNGIAKSDAYNQYLAYHQGHTGYARGSYRGKAWLLDVAQRVQDRANMYKSQLATCRRRGR
ncbi:MAG: lytic transglycosylase [Rhodobacteraceae bacterium]|nr:lytic transglycosylase [Paracoccaceae bacterium]